MRVEPLMLNRARESSRLLSCQLLPRNHVARAYQIQLTQLSAARRGN